MRLTFLIALLLLAAGCQVNPVTGERHLQFYGSDWEQQVGASMYSPLRQSQGGDFKVDPELTAYVQSVGERLAVQAKRKDELQFEFHVLNDSTPNAWALPGGKISINRGLLTELNSEAELAAVLGHEIVHADAAHGARAQSKGMVTQIGAIAGMILISSKTDSSAGQQAAAIVPALGAQLITSKYGRDAERESDRYGMQYMSEAGYDSQGAIDLQKTFVKLSEGRNNDRMSVLFASHPPSQERVDLNTQTAQTLPSGGEMGTERYQQKMAYLNSIKPAYDAYDTAIKAAVKEDYDAARSELSKALKIEPRESIFHALDGDLYAEAKQNAHALRAFNKAVELDDSFFYPLLRRGELRLDMGEPQAARSDLENSLAMLPTAQAHYLLGNMDRNSGQIESARSHYEQASQSTSEAGQNAQRELVLMDIDSNPGQFVATAHAADEKGQIYCRIGNKTNVELTAIIVSATFRDDAGQAKQAQQTYSSTLEGSKQDSINMGWTTSNTLDLDNRVRCDVQSARVVQK
ncbi:MAG: putative Zn-dependent protease [Lysobacterales bacterium]|jgi:predicted Zn-dependent protease